MDKFQEFTGYSKSQFEDALKKAFVEEGLPNETYIINKEDVDYFNVKVPFKYANLGVQMDDIASVQRLAALIRFARMIEQETEFVIGFEPGADDANVVLTPALTYASFATMEEGGLEPELLETSWSCCIRPNSRGPFLTRSYRFEYQYGEVEGRDEEFKAAFNAGFYSWRSKFEEMYHNL